MNDTMQNAKGNARGKRRMEAVVNLAAGVTGIMAATAAMADGSPKISLHKPTNEWIEGLPLANGISAAMLWGAPSRTVLSLNHVDFWRHDLNLDPLPDLSKLMAETRQLMMAGKAQEANDFFRQKVMGQLHNLPKHHVPQGSGYTDAFEPVGDIVIALDGQENVTGYTRTLDLAHGMASISYRIGDNELREECFVPAQADVVILTLSASKPISGQVYATRPRPGKSAAPATVNPDYKWSAAAKDGKIEAEGSYSEGVESAVRAVLQLRAGGKIIASSAIKSASAADTSDALKFEGATELRLLIAVDSGRRPHDPRAAAEKKAIAALTAEIDTVRREHVREHQAMFNRVELSLTDKPGGSPADAEQLVSRAMQGSYDNEMAALMFHYGRYLMMSCNRAGRRPANLQGIWNHDQYAAWDADWHLDLNVEMNQWMCNPCHLDECNLPLFKQMEYFIPQGRMIARRMCGCEGILFPIVCGGDGMNLGTDDPFNVFWCGAAAWIAEHYWEHYEFTLDRKFLAERAYPFLKEVGLFFKGWLIKNPDGKYVTGFSFSPENTPPNGFINNVHCTMDTALIRELTANLLEAGKLLNVDRELWPVWQDLHDNVLPYPIGQAGELKEWPEPLCEQPAHRHFSHLLPLFPGDEFTREGTPKLFEAARKALLLRETKRDAWVSWSFPYAACLYARLGEGDNALKNLHELARQNTVNNLLIGMTADYIGYRLFQIEANFAASMAVAEMLVQSHEGFIRLLPALPTQWATGHYRGLKARGAFTVDCSWKDGKVTEAAITSLKGTPCKLRNSRPWKSVKVTSNGKTVVHAADAGTGAISFSTQAGKVYKLNFE